MKSQLFYVVFCVCVLQIRIPLTSCARAVRLGSALVYLSKFVCAHPYLVRQCLEKETDLYLGHICLIRFEYAMCVGVLKPHGACDPKFMALNLLHDKRRIRAAALRTNLSKRTLDTRRSRFLRRRSRRSRGSKRGQPKRNSKTVVSIEPRVERVQVTQAIK
jgi:hypothetical protein